MSKVSFIESVKCAIKGIFYGISSERMLKVLVLLGIFAVSMSLILKVSKEYFITILIVIFLVIILELFNKNFEKLIDLVSPEYNKQAGEIKDTIAGIVLLAFILLVIVASLILYEPIIKFLKIISSSSIPLSLMIFNIVITIFILLYRKNNHQTNQKQSSHQQPYY